MDFSRFTTISFDCYGTLVNWESGILPTLRALLNRHKQTAPDAAILELYGEFEAEEEASPYQSYRKVLESVVERFGSHFGFSPSPDEARSLHQSLPSWPPFPDTVSALRQLQKRYRLAVISNIDDDLFAETRKHLGVEFDFVITAQQARSYKPSLNNFRLGAANDGAGAGSPAARGAKYLSRCCAGTIVRDCECLGEPEIGATECGRGSCGGRRAPTWKYPMWRVWLLLQLRGDLYCEVTGIRRIFFWMAAVTSCALL